MLIFFLKTGLEKPGLPSQDRLGGMAGVLPDKRHLGALMTREAQDPIRQPDHLGTDSLR